MHAAGGRIGPQIWHTGSTRSRGEWLPEFPELDAAEGLNFAGWAKKLTGAATISVGSVGLDGDFFGAFGGKGSGAAVLDNRHLRMARQEFDLIAVGRVLISDAGWANKVRNGEPLPTSQRWPDDARHSWTTARALDHFSQAHRLPYCSSPRS